MTKIVQRRGVGAGTIDRAASMSEEFEFGNPVLQLLRPSLVTDIGHRLYYTPVSLLPLL